MFTMPGVGAISRWTGRHLTILLVAAVTVAAFPHSTPASVSRSQDARRSALITGANRGLGLEFARQLHAAGYNVIGTARKPEAATELSELGVRVEQLDVTDAESVAALVRRLGDQPLDMLINNAGIGGRGRSIADADMEAITRILQVNAIGPMRVTKALLPSLKKGTQKLVINISSMLGSIENNRGGGNYGYRESKAALNMFTRSLAAELKPDGFRCIAMSPGWVRTDMGGSRAPLSPAESIAGMLEVINGLKATGSGGFFNYTGEKLPW